MKYFISNSGNKMFSSMYVDQYDIPVERTPETHPYNYDSYVIKRCGPNSEVTGGVYSDRLYQADYAGITALTKKYCGTGSQYWSEFSVTQIRDILREHLKSPELEIIYVMQGCNQSSGYPLWYIAFKRPEIKDGQ